VSRAVSALRLSPVMFELGARPHPPQELYRAYLAQSDVFIGLYWQRYGWVGPGMEISGLEDEFRLSGGFPRLLYVKVPAPEREPRLTEMLARIEAEGSVSYRHFRTARELGRLVRDDLAMLLSEQFSAGRPSPAGRAGVGRAGVGRVRCRWTRGRWLGGSGRSARWPPWSGARGAVGDVDRVGRDRQDPAGGGGG
jgi:hypothetical protein